MEQKIDSDCSESSHAGFRHLLPFLVIPMAFVMMRGMARHNFSRISARREGWKNGVPPMFAELHRRAHAADLEKPVQMEA